MIPAVVFVGPPGAGKTTVAQRVASELNLEFRDTDHDVEIAQGRTIQDIFVDSGEAAFRVLEREAVARALAEHNGVLALGGGAVLADSTRELLRGSFVVFLDVSLAEAASRVGMNSGRPLLMGNVRSTLKSLLDARRPLYSEVATVTIDTSKLAVEEVVVLVVQQLETTP